jgi:hypothetical protein
VKILGITGSLNLAHENSSGKLEDLDQICYYSIRNYYFQGEKSIPLAEKIQELLFDEFDVYIDGKKLNRLESLSNDNSLGIYYLNVIYILDYKKFDEYKVMGLAPYGNPDTYRDLFRTFYKLPPEAMK